MLTKAGNLFPSLKAARESLIHDGFIISRLHTGLTLGEVWIDTQTDIFALITKIPFANRWVIRYGE